MTGDATTPPSRPARVLTRRRRYPAAGERPRACFRNATWSSSMFSATVSCDVMCVIPDSGSTECGYPAASSADDSRSECATNTLSSASPWMMSSGRT